MNHVLDDFAVGARQRSFMAMPFEDTARHGGQHQHRSHHDISRLDVGHNTNSPGAAVRRFLHFTVYCVCNYIYLSFKLALIHHAVD